MKELLEDAPDQFDEDRDGVDKMITYEFIIMSAGAAKAHDPHREELRRKLWAVVQPIIEDRIAPFVRQRYPKAGAVCHAMIRRYLHRERRTHNTHWDIPSYVSVVVSLDSAGGEFDGGLFVTTGTGLNTFIPLQRGDTVVHQSDLLHGVHVQRGNRWSLAMWFQDSYDCNAQPADWWAKEADEGNPVAQTLRAMRARTSEESWAWLQSAAESGFPRAQLYLGKAFQDGLGGRSKDLSAASKWYSEARRLGEFEANFYLGQLELASGNASGAASLFQEGARIGEPNAMRAFGDLLREGSEFIGRDIDAATSWHERAADFVTDAMYKAFLLYNASTPTRDRDEGRASLYLERAARMGHHDAMIEFVKPLLQGKQWAAAIPWLLRMESRMSMTKFVQILQAGAPVDRFTLFRGEQLLEGLVAQGYEEARTLLAGLSEVRASRQ